MTIFQVNLDDLHQNNWSPQDPVSIEPSIIYNSGYGHILLQVLWYHTPTYIVKFFNV